MSKTASKSATITKLIDELEWLYESYSNEVRAATQPYHLLKIKSEFASYHYDPADEVVRESLLEHVGALPIIATTIYPYIDDKSVDLGEALIMLAIHDIGELATGDEITFTKKSKREVDEQKEALKLLDRSYHDLLRDIENQKSQSAKFAKAIDKLAGDIMDYVTPADVTIERFKHFVGVEVGEIVPLLVKHKRPYMLWNPFMTDLHIALIDRFEEKLQKAKR